MFYEINLSKLRSIRNKYNSGKSSSLYFLHKGIASALRKCVWDLKDKVLWHQTWDTLQAYDIGTVNNIIPPPRISQSECSIFGPQFLVLTDNIDWWAHQCLHAHSHLLNTLLTPDNPTQWVSRNWRLIMAWFHSHLQFISYLC